MSRRHGNTMGLLRGLVGAARAAGAAGVLDVAKNKITPYLGELFVNMSNSANRYGVPEELSQYYLDKSLNAIHNTSKFIKQAANTAIGVDKDFNLYKGGPFDIRRQFGTVPHGFDNDNEPNATMPNPISRNYAPATAFVPINIPGGNKIKISTDTKTKKYIKTADSMKPRNFPEIPKAEKKEFQPVNVKKNKKSNKTIKKTNNRKNEYLKRKLKNESITNPQNTGIIKTRTSGLKNAPIKEDVLYDTPPLKHKTKKYINLKDFVFNVPNI